MVSRNLGSGTSGNSITAEAPHEVVSYLSLTEWLENSHGKVEGSWTVLSWEIKVVSMGLPAPRGLTARTMWSTNERWHLAQLHSEIALATPGFYAMSLFQE